MGPASVPISRYRRSRLEAKTPTEQDYRAAEHWLSSGQVIGLPTETVYGLAGDATNQAAVRRIFELKRRPIEHPLIVHLGDVSWLSESVKHVPEMARRLAERFWPGPLTLILERSLRVPHEVTGGLETVALRVPAHPVALKLLTRFGRPLAAPSANLFGSVSPTRASHVRADFGSMLPFVLDGGPCQVGVESTILDVRGTPRLLRPGGLARDQIEDFLGLKIASGTDGAHPVRAPGTLASHYAPRARLERMTFAELSTRAKSLNGEQGRVGIFAPGLEPDAIATLGAFEPEPHQREAGMNEFRGELSTLGAQTIPAIILTTPETPKDIAHALYAALRALDKAGCDAIWAVVPSAGTLGEAVDDRLLRASAPRDSGS